MSVVSGISAGIRRLSMINMVLAFALLAFVLFAGPTRYIAQTFVDGLGAYIQNLPQMSLRTTPGEDGGWQAKWTLFYWGWWISWCPFVGIFTARISRGRTVREYVVAVLLVPATLTFLWLAVFGGAGLHAALEAGADIASVVQDRPALGLYALLETLPGAKVSSALATLVVIFFFITSSDSGSLVDDMVTSGGHPNPPKAQRVFWAVSEGAVAATLLVTGGLEALQTASIAAGLPMSVFLIFAAIGLYRGLRADVEVEGVPDVEVLAGRERA